MNDKYVNALHSLGRKLRQEQAVTVTLPPIFAFKDHSVLDVDNVLRLFDWQYRDVPVRIDLTQCATANYQALSLVVLYCWKLKSQGCTVTILESPGDTGASAMWRKMGARGVFPILLSETQNFHGSEFKPMFAVRTANDFKTVIETADSYTREFNIEYTNTLRYILSELLYNTMEHGHSAYEFENHRHQMPSLVQFTYYQKYNELHFIVADLGVGIKKHLEQAYPGQDSHITAIKLAIRPHVSGTFASSEKKKKKNNAGVGLYISTNIVRRLSADMHIVSGDGHLHVSGRDITGKSLANSWPGTVVLVTLRLGATLDLSLHRLMQEFRTKAMDEQKKGDSKEDGKRFYFSIANEFGSFAEYTPAAVGFRDNKLMPAVAAGRVIVIDCDGVSSAPHSFLSALLATPIKVMGLKSYKMMKVINASSEVRETIDFIMDENTE